MSARNNKRKGSIPYFAARQQLLLNKTFKFDNTAANLFYRPYHLMVRIIAFQAGNGSSILPRAARLKLLLKTVLQKQQLLGSILFKSGVTSKLR